MSRRDSRTCRVIDNPGANSVDIEWLTHRNRRAAYLHPNLPAFLIRTRRDARIASQNISWSLLVLEQPRLLDLR